MLVYRVFGYDPAAAIGGSGHPTYIFPRQTTGRWDNYDQYKIVYVAASPEGAIAEMFARIPEWSDSMFDVGYLPGGRFALATFSVPDGISLRDLDDANTLVEMSLRPTQVVIQNPSYTQGLALSIFRERRNDGSKRWAGIRWWSAWKAQWPVMAIWIEPGEPFPLRLQSVEPLDVAHIAVVDAASSLVRQFVS
ncbi:RES domain-containing protein [uncultured Salinibacterium sp.]|uniref:RES domain-containing protein n=1 Tax=uncultured Salinibacterium sp. TaxID=459274 RepID=UPI0030DA8A4D